MCYDCKSRGFFCASTGYVAALSILGLLVGCAGESAPDYAAGGALQEASETAPDYSLVESSQERPASAVDYGLGGALRKKRTIRPQVALAAQDFMRSATLLAAGDTTQAALQAAESAIDYWLPGLGDDGPEWLSRFEFEWQVRDNDKPEFSLLTVQPLYQSDDQRDTIFTQLRVARDYTFGEHRITTNAGLGYRRLVADNTVLLGANAFFDHEWKVDHSRVGVGAEARWAGLDLYANYYKALTGKHSSGTDNVEEALDGFDVELTAQVPYLPWARVRGQYFVWDTQSVSDDINGYTGAIELDIHQNLQLELGYSDDDFSDGFFFAQFRFIPGNRNRPALLSDHAIADRAFDLRDMRGHTLDKVRRVNTIVLDRTTGGTITISRGS